MPQQPLSAGAVALVGRAGLRFDAADGQSASFLIMPYMTRSASVNGKRAHFGAGMGVCFYPSRSFCFSAAVRCCRPRLAFPIIGWEPVPPAIYSIPLRGTMISASNSLALKGGRGPIHLLEDQPHPSGVTGLPLHANRIRGVVRN